MSGWRTRAGWCAEKSTAQFARVSVARGHPSEFRSTVSDAYGFLVEVIDGNVHFQPALYDGTSGSFPSIMLQGTCSVVEDAMRTFAERFRRVGGS